MGKCFYTNTSKLKQATHQTPLKDEWGGSDPECDAESMEEPKIGKLRLVKPEYGNEHQEHTTQEIKTWRQQLGSQKLGNQITHKKWDKWLNNM